MKISFNQIVSLSKGFLLADYQAVTILEDSLDFRSSDFYAAGKPTCLILYIDA